MGGEGRSSLQSVLDAGWTESSPYALAERFFHHSAFSRSWMDKCQKSPLHGVHGCDVLALVIADVAEDIVEALNANISGPSGPFSLYKCGGLQQQVEGG